jgi:hypothetical protein
MKILDGIVRFAPEFFVLAVARYEFSPTNEERTG